MSSSSGGISSLSADACWYTSESPAGSSTGFLGSSGAGGEATALRPVCMCTCMCVCVRMCVCVCVSKAHPCAQTQNARVQK